MAIEEKNMPLHELKYYHGESLGFVFKGVTPSSLESIERLSHTLVSCGASKKLPEFFVRVSDNEVAFVYSDDSGFLSGPFWRLSQQVSKFGLFEIDTLASWLKSH